MKPFLEEYRKEIRVLMGALLFAAICDLFYGGVAGADASLVGIILGGVSTLLFTVFTIMVLFKLVTRFFASESFRGFIDHLPEYEPEPEIKPAPKGKKK